MSRQSNPNPVQTEARRAAMLALMGLQYEEIREIELRHAISVDERDIRPRIEYFHDAVRLLTDHPESVYQPRTRLSVEWLAYDLGQLRIIQDKPMLGLDRRHVMGSASGQVAKHDNLPETVRASLSDRYRPYTVFFAALFADVVDRNFHSRVDQMNSEVEEIAQIEQMIQQLAQGKSGFPENQVEELIQQLSSDELRQKLMVMLHQQSMKKRERLESTRLFIKGAITNIDKQITFLDKQHMNYLSSQLTLMQESKDMVKKLSSQGLNLAGRFLEIAFQQAGMGRGR